MEPQEEKTCLAFAGEKRIARGTAQEVALAAHAWLQTHQDQSFLFFDWDSGQQIEFDLRGSRDEVLARYAPTPPASTPEKRPGPGRPKLGVVCQEVCLLPRHWEWLSSQPQGASGTLRRLVDEARKASAGKDRARDAQNAAHKFMWSIAGNLPQFEEASRAFFARDYRAMRALMQPWPEDIRSTLWELVQRTEELEKLA